jgi:hypothetical protein
MGGDHRLGQRTSLQGACVAEWAVQARRLSRRTPAAAPSEARAASARSGSVLNTAKERAPSFASRLMFRKQVAEDDDLAAGHPGPPGKDSPAVKPQPPAGERLGPTAPLLSFLAVHFERSRAMVYARLRGTLSRAAT